MKRLSLLPVLLIAACAANAPTAASTPQFIHVQYTFAAQPWLAEVYDCAPDVVIIVEERSVYYFDADIEMAMRIGEPFSLTSPTYQIGSEEIVVVLNPHNPLADMTIENVRAIFSGRLTNWQELGGESAPVQVWAFPAGEDAQQVFDKQALGGMPVASLTRLATSPQEMLEAIAADVHAIGLLPRRWQSDDVRAVFTLEAAPVLVITTEEPQGALQELLVCLQK